MSSASNVGEFGTEAWEKYERADFPEAKAIRDIDSLLRCPICRETFTQAMGFTKGCDHVFCANCITTWLQTNKECPSCRGVISSSNIRFCRVLDKLAKQVKSIRPFLLEQVKEKHSKLGSLPTAPASTTSKQDSEEVNQLNTVDGNRATMSIKVYNFLSDAKLRSELISLGLQKTGPRKLLEFRHKEYTRLHNIAAKDTNNPMKSAQELRAEVTAREKLIFGKSNQAKKRTVGSSDSDKAEQDKLFRKLRREVKRRMKAKKKLAKKKEGELETAALPGGHDTAAIPGDHETVATQSAESSLVASSSLETKAKLGDESTPTKVGHESVDVGGPSEPNTRVSNLMSENKYVESNVLIASEQESIRKSAQREKDNRTNPDSTNSSATTSASANGDQQSKNSCGAQVQNAQDSEDHRSKTVTRVRVQAPATNAQLEEAVHTPAAQRQKRKSNAVSTAPNQGWICTGCTYLNWNVNSKKCVMCTTPRKEQPSKRQCAVVLDLT